MSNTVKKLVVILGLIAAATISVSAVPAQQNLNPVSGKVLDAATGEGEPYVTYSIASAQAPADAAPMKKALSPSRFPTAVTPSPSAPSGRKT